MGAQTTDAIEMQSRHSAGLARIAGVVGQWTGNNLRWDAKAQKWAAPTPQLSDIRFSKMDHERAFRLFLKSPAYQVDGYLAYDVWNDRYSLVSIDDFIGQVDLQQGQFSGDQLILDNLKADTVYQAKSLAVNTRITIRFVDHRPSEIQIDSSQDHGKVWRPTQLIQLKAADR